MGLFSRLFGRGGSRDAAPLKISPEHLPPELRYIIPLADRHGNEARVKHFDHRLGRHVSYAENLAPNDIDELRTLYEEIRAKDHSELINRWYSASRETGCPAETSWPIWGLLCLFSQLGELDIAPFNDGAVGPMKFPEELDWSKLPAPLRYLAGSAEVYGAYQFDDKIQDFLQSRMTAEERDELKLLNERYGRDFDAVNRWLDEYPMTKHPEARLVYFTGHLLGMAHEAGLI